MLGSVLLFSSTLILASPCAPQCSVANRPVAKRVEGLPPAVLKALPYRIANPQEPFRVTDVVSPGQRNLPWARLICGYSTPNGYIIEREQGGRGYNVGRILFYKTSTGFRVG